MGGDDDGQAGWLAMRQLLVNRAAGVLFATLLVAGGWYAYAVFDQSFADVAQVTVEAPRAGLQLPRNADVMVRGVIVGTVRSVESSGDGAVLDVAIDSDQVGAIPSNVTARILPKTLFGEKYVELDVPAEPSSTALQAGDVVRQTSVSIEVQQVLADTYPLLTAVQPEQLSYTLNAVSSALEGRGAALGDNLVRLDALLQEVNPLVPQLVADAAKLDRVSDIYRQVLPDLAITLDNTVLTGNTVVEKREQLTAFLDSVTGLSETARAFLQANAANIVRVSELSQPTLELLARYAPEYPCLTEGMVNWIPRMNSVYRDHIFHINLELIPRQPTGYGPADDPVYDAHNGPHCETLPSPPYSQANPGPQPAPGVVDDGVETDHGLGYASPGRPE
jgi:phospholipid/cholesterol/gamma-HCH transport system substrate-binding protein